MKIIFASDHAGFSYKKILLKKIEDAGYETLDLGTYTDGQEDDYPDYAEDVAHALLEGRGARGILICGSAVGVSIAANKFRGIRAAVCHDAYSAHQSVEHDNANILCIGERVVGIELAADIVLMFLAAHFSNEARHVRRLEKILILEDKNMKEVL